MFLSLAYSCQTEVTLLILCEIKIRQIDSSHQPLETQRGDLCHSPFSSTLFQECSSKPSLSNDLVKGITLITLEKLKAADHLQGSPGNCISPPPKRQEHTLITHKSSKQSLLGYMLYSDANVIKCIKGHHLEEGWRSPCFGVTVHVSNSTKYVDCNI